MTDAMLLQEVARLQFRKDMLDIRDIIDSIPISEYNPHSYSNNNLTAEEFKKLLLVKLKELNYE